ncbi:MAG: transcription factor S [Candidatus Woesearchaeota archaeon]
MLFCPECGSILMPKEEDGERIMACSCGYSSKKSQSLKESVKKTKDIEVVSNEQDYDSLPTTKTECPKCGHDLCYYWLVQTRAADEPETKFLRCCKCKHTFRDYG